MAQYLDTRDLNKRLEELEALEEELKEARQELAEAGDEDDINAARDEITRLEDDEFGDEEIAELKELRDLRDEIGSEWRYGETLIPDSEWVDYVRELAEDIGAVSRENSDWVVIDWVATAENVSQDYQVVTYQGEEYYVRYS